MSKEKFEYKIAKKIGEYDLVNLNDEKKKLETFLKVKEECESGNLSLKRLEEVEKLIIQKEEYLRILNQKYK